MARLTRLPSTPRRGQVWFVDVIGVGEKPFVIVSSNGRNEHLDSILAARVTKAEKPRLASIVELPAREPLKGRVLCDEIMLFEKSDLKRLGGTLSPAAMDAVGTGLRSALALD